MSDTFRQDLAGDCTQAGARIANEYNLRNWQDLNTVFINKSFGYLVPARTDSNNTYTKLCTINLSGNDATAITRFTLMTRDNWVDKGMEFVDVLVRTGIRGSKNDGVKKAYIDIVNAKRIYLENIVGVVTQDDANGYSVEIYFKHNYANYNLILIPTFEKVNYRIKAKITFTNSQASQAALPAGTALTTTGGVFETVNMRVFYEANAFVLHNPDTYAVLGGIVNSDDNVFLYGTPTWDGASFSLIFPETSIIRKSTTKIVAMSPFYISSSVTPYIPMLRPGTTRGVRFINPADGAVVTAASPSQEMCFLLTFAHEKR